MMLRRRRENNRRRGMTVVESTLVLAVFLMLLFGIFEYCRFLMVLHVTQNAARDGARYAVVNLDKPTNFTTTNYGTKISIHSYTTLRMGAMQKQINNVHATYSPTGFQIAVYACDPDGLNLTPPVVRPKRASTASGFPDPFVYGAANSVAWNEAEFSERVAVTIRGTYQPFTPVLLIMPTAIPIYATSIMGSEG
jgi:Flp pilus assembly protein TadG